jgi:integrating conjugative element protein (TIGR03752 family)
MTALVGRIPTNGQVTDPYPFKILVGEDNLSSNGIQIPGVVGIKMSGLAKGDWTLSCVTGQIYSMTFTFQDGTIATIPEPGTKAKDPLAWLSDINGIPCMTGQRITNAVSFLSSRIGLAAASSYANAEAASQFTTTNNNSGTTSALTGDPKIVAKNTAISSGLNEASDWLEERQENSFDAIYAPPGTDVNIHINDELQIDYDPEGRKVNHYANITTRSANYLD